MRVLLAGVVLTLLAKGVKAPRVPPAFFATQGAGTSADGDSARRAASSASVAAGVAAAGAGIAAILAAAAIKPVADPDVPIHINRSAAGWRAKKGRYFPKGGGLPPIPTSPTRMPKAADKQQGDSEDELGDYESEADAEPWEASADEDDASEVGGGSDGDNYNPGSASTSTRRVGKKGAGKLWTLQQFPEGTKGASNWDPENMDAAQAWSCPCPDRRNCIGAERINSQYLFEYRKTFLTTTHRRGGMRDAMRTELEGHYCTAN
eukprot:6101616-Pleurochrysis_carterae.AAC.1